jgi:hypothetical protein
MKKFVLLLVSALAFAQLSFYPKDEPTFYNKEHYQKEQWYPILITKLNKEDRADAASAQWISTLSSNSGLAFERSIPRLIEKIGKIDEKEIRVFFRESESDPQVFIFVQTTYSILDLFIFNTKSCELKRVRNNGIIVALFGEVIRLKEVTADGLLFCADHQNSGNGKLYRKYMYVDLKQNSFTHTKNCELVNGAEKCTTVN